jgi:hypothetical protein
METATKRRRPQDGTRRIYPVGVCLSGRLMDFAQHEADDVMGGLALSHAIRVLVVDLLETWRDEGQLDVDHEAQPGRSRPRGAHLRYERSVWFNRDELALLKAYSAGRDLALGSALREALRLELFSRRAARGLPIFGDYVY